MSFHIHNQDSLTVLLISAARPRRHGELTYKTKTLA